MKTRLILVTTTADAAACRAALAALLGRGWDTQETLTPWPPDPTPATTATPTAYLLDAPVDDAQAAQLAALVAAVPDRTLKRARLLGVEDKDGVVVEGERLTLRETLTAHEGKTVRTAEAEPKVRG